MKIDKKIKKDLKAVKRALKVFKDEKRLNDVHMVIRNNSNVTINIKV